MLKVFTQTAILPKHLLMSENSCVRTLTLLPNILTYNQYSKSCIKCGGKLSSANEILLLKRCTKPIPRPSSDRMLIRSTFRPAIISESLQSGLLTPNLSNNCLSATQNLISRNYSTTSRVLSGSTALSSAVSSTVVSPTVPSAETIASVVNSTSSHNLIFPDFFPLYTAEKTLEYIHHLTGLPWWATIVLSAFMLRVVMMIPLTIHNFRNMARLINLQPEVKEMAERLKLEVSMAMHQFKWDEKRARQEYNKNLKRLLTNLYIKNNCHPMKGVAVYWVQLPIWVSVTYALRNISTKAIDSSMADHLKFKDLTEQGLPWIPDLTMIDSTWLLPIMMGAVTLFNIEVGYLNLSEVTKYRKWLTYGLRGLVLVIVPVCSTMPSGMVLYWVSSGTFAALQNFMFEYSPFRRLVGLPKSSTESNSPLHSLGQKAKERYWKK